MEGITVLHSFINHDPVIGYIFLWIVAALGVITSIYLWYLAATHRNKYHVFGSVIATIFTIIMLFTVIFNPVSNETQYKITIDPCVSYIEFTENFEVVDIEGSIYTVKIINKDFSFEDGAPAPSEDTTEEWTYPTETIAEETWDPSAVG